MAAAHYAAPRSLSLPATYIHTSPASPTSSSPSTSTESSLSPMTPPLASFPSPPSALRKKDSLLSYHSQQSQEPSTSGASIRSSSTSKSFGTTLLEAYHEWKEADEALQRLHLEERDRDECAIELAAAKEVVGKLKADRDAVRFPERRKVIRKSSKLTFWKHKNPADLPFQDAPAPDTTVADVAAASVRESELERESHRRNMQVEATRQLAATLDARYDRLKQIFDSGPLPSWRFTEGNEQAILRAEKTVAAREASYADCIVTTETLHRARRAVQSAHLYYTEGMNLLDTVCSPSRSGFMAALSDEQSKSDTYKEAAAWSHKAHVCLQECLRVLEPHMELLDAEQIAAAEQLREVGLLQGVRLYELMYGGKALAFGITQQVGIMVNKLDAVYRFLTNFAVGVQNCAKNCESVQESERHSRDVARRELVALWMNDSSRASASSSRNSHSTGYLYRNGTL